MHVICLTARPKIYKSNKLFRNNGQKTTEILWSFGIYPHEIRLTDYQPKGLFIEHILLEHKGAKAIFIDNNNDQIDSAVKSQAPLHAMFWYLGDLDIQQ